MPQRTSRNPPDDYDDDDIPDSYSFEDAADSETFPCPVCKKPVFEDADYCPNCKNYISPGDLEHPGKKPLWFVITAWVCILTFTAWAILFFLDLLTKWIGL